jgi:hypothetical protein
MSDNEKQTNESVCRRCGEGGVYKKDGPNYVAYGFRLCACPSKDAQSKNHDEFGEILGKNGKPIADYSDACMRRLCKMDDPVRRSYSREEMRDASEKWMIEQYGSPKEMKDNEKARWHERCGMLNHFIFDHFPLGSTR